jgi:hypothetical protein
MAKAKYIILDHGIPEPIVFSDTLTHFDVAFALGGKNKVLGAGFCYIADDQYVCYGTSTSLKIDSRGEKDSEVLNRRLGNSYE